MYPYPELYILRHGETLWNQQGRLQGQKDSPLTDKGRQQALAQGEVLRSVKSLPHIVFVSPLGRTLTTANLAAPFIKTHVKDPRLLEINFGAWEGATRDAINISNLNKFKKRLDPRLYNGAIFIGLDSPVVKSHGGTDYIGFSNSLDVCHRIVKGNLIEKIKQNI